MKPVISQMDGPDKAPESEFTGEHEAERDIASSMATLLLRNPKMQTSLKRMDSGESRVNNNAGLAAAQVVLGVRDKMMQHKLLSNDKIWVAQGGVLDNVLDEVGATLGGSFDHDSAKAFALDVLQKFDEAGKQSKAQGAGGTTAQPPPAAGAAQGSSALPIPPGGGNGRPPVLKGD